ncbi:F420-0:Gamma-glutamyl ligase [Stenomitos frigidus ULC18]|uniref:F420-0:Gamma-glutamyl ligase n=1 Tax=Stenomitos frigidus ULC18 TaxID=2107698 RepID=A0A2T1DW18_9CYAN|nr:F420-0:Gamma-glutamyl ligase [Stenomitos frigidus]PSB24669.1 F420-0:Gamma-glutamyl ligase [Stenomitos frigidus ULC18]
MIGSIAIAIVVVAVFLLLALDLQYRLRPGNKLELTAGNWQLESYEPQRYLLVGELAFHNLTQRFEVMVPEIWVEVKLLSAASLKGITTSTQVIPRYQGAEFRADGYWEGHIVKQDVSPIEIQVELQGDDLIGLRVAWIRVHYMTYGPQGRFPKVRHVIVPLTFPSADDSKHWRPANNADVLPIRTHLLTHLDNPVAVIQRYVLPNAQPGDVVTIGETPLAIMQGRFRHPSEVKPGWVARRLCYLFLPTSSLATACGLQTLVDLVGPVRVLVAFLVGAIAKVLGKPGVFYQLAGEQARLIDDVTGTIPPYDQFIVLGPDNPQQVVDQIKRETGLSAAIVDVNDLRAVKVLAASSDLSVPFLKQALIKNPAGNASEQTPVVLIRPVKALGE